MKKKTLRKWQVEITTESRTARINKRTVKSLIKQILAEVDLSHIPKTVSAVSVLFTDDLKIHELNSQYRGKDKPTDVLSFSHIEGDDFGQSPIVLGDLIISLETAKRQAPKFNNNFKEEIARLIIHGMLHLVGYDHENVSRAEAQRMRKAELRLVGVIAKKTVRQVLLEDRASYSAKATKDKSARS